MPHHMHSGEGAGRTRTALKGLALTRRVRELKARGVKMSEPRLAKQLVKARSTIATWKAGRAWPSPGDEAALEEALSVPRGFFARVGAGVTYEKALQPTPTDTDDKATTLRQLAHLLTVPAATRPDGVYTMTEIQSHLTSQISLLYRLVMPEGVTEEGMREANALLRALLAQRARKA